MAAIGLRFTDEDEARAILERLRWPNGPLCPDCKGTDVNKIASEPGSKTRRGLYRCRTRECPRKQFTVTVGTIFEDSHIPLSKWLSAIHLLCASKKGMSAHQLHRMLGVTYKTAWFMAHRIREAMRREPLRTKLTGVVEVDETYVGGKPENRHHRIGKPKAPVVSLVQRGGETRSFPVPAVTAENLRTMIRREVSPKAKLVTDGHSVYQGIGREYAAHEPVNHQAREYVRGEAHTNTVEGYFSILKRGINGIYHHVGPQHLARYCDEFDFRYNRRLDSDSVRSMAAIRGAEGKRLTYKPLVARNGDGVQ
jgi:transposase-like protein